MHLDNRRLLLTGLTAALVLVASCSDSVGKSSAEQSSVTSVGAETQFRRDASDYEKPLLADGVVTRAELDQARAAAVACMKSQGIVEESDEYLPPFEIGFRTKAAVDGSISGQQVGLITESCKKQYFDVVSQTFLLNNPPSAEQQEALRRGIIECMRAEGVKVKESASADELVDDFATDRRYVECKTNVERRLGSA